MAHSRSSIMANASRSELQAKINICIESIATLLERLLLKDCLTELILIRHYIF
jgi:predicted transcriptional regulator